MELNDINLKELIERETGNRFDRQGSIACPFHNEKTPSMKVKFFPDANKEKFTCFGCKENGDAIDFIMKLKNIDFKAAKKHLGLEVEQSEKEKLEDKVRGYIDWEIKNTEYRKNKILLGLFSFTNERNEIVYFKAKFKDPSGKKSLSYYHVEKDKVINKRNGEELPYNLYRTLKAIDADKVIVIVEGEKDANTLNSIFKGNKYEATSLKGVKDLLWFKGRKARLYVCGDTGKAGERYKEEIKNELIRECEEFRLINLPGIQALGDNKDVTDWFEAGHTKKELFNAFNRSLDLKSKYELQQDYRGIYKYALKGKGDDADWVKIYLTNFNLIAATRINFIGEDAEGVKLVLKASTGAVFERIGLSTFFDDIKSFKNFLGSIELSFKGKIDDLTDIKAWINTFFALETEEVYQGSTFVNKDNKMLFITDTGALDKNGNVNKAIKCQEGSINLDDIDYITAQELRSIKDNIFKFSTPEKSISILGTIINNLAVAQSEELKVKLHHLLIVGESGAGKSTVLENIIAPILNYPLIDKKDIGSIKSFTLTKDLSDGNYSTLYEEFKPSKIGQYSMNIISGFLRNLYDRTTITKGRKDLSIKRYTLARPIIILGEESYPNAEKALMERSCIVYFAKSDQTPKSSEAIKWIKNNEKLLNKFGKSLIKTVLGITPEEYKKIRESEEEKISDLNNRPKNTAVNICCGIQIFNKLLADHKIQVIKKYEKHVVENIKGEVLDGGEEAKSVVEQMLILYNEMIEDGRAIEPTDVIHDRGDGIFIRTSEMLNQISAFVNSIGSADVTPLKLRDFKKQAIKSGYIIGVSDKLIKQNKKVIRFDTYSKSKLRNLSLDAIVEPDMQPLIGEENKIIPFA